MAKRPDEHGEQRDPAIDRVDQVQRMRVPFAILRQACVNRDRKLSICCDDLGAEASEPVPHRTVERPDLRLAAIPVAPRWHMIDRVVSQQADKRIQICRVPCFDVAFQQVGRLGALRRPLCGTARRVSAGQPA